MVTRKQIKSLENKFKQGKNEEVEKWDLSELSDEELEKLHQIVLKREEGVLTAAEEAEAERILRSVDIVI